MSMKSINGSLRRLNTNYITPSIGALRRSRDAVGGGMQAFADVMRQGKNLDIGVSE